ncbi:MAG: hypothetical protein LBL01_06530 [Bifidobacteriaceae bacterium]|nr:hypothetical protein [Bifidobacteriaceae bacterium]
MDIDGVVNKALEDADPEWAEFLRTGNAPPEGPADTPPEAGRITPHNGKGTPRRPADGGAASAMPEGQASTVAEAEATAPPEAKGTPRRPPGDTAATKLVRLAWEHFIFHRDPNGTVYATEREGPAHVALPLRGAANGTSLAAKLTSLWWDKYGQAAPSQAITDALKTLESKAEPASRELDLRCAELGGESWIDLADKSNPVVRVSQRGWRIVTSGVPVRFVRTVLTAPMTPPSEHGDLDPLWATVNVAVPYRPVVLAWMVQALMFPEQPQPILLLGGEPGSGKTTVARRICDLIDPSPAGPRGAPSRQEEWLTIAQGARVIPLDNLSRVPEWLANALCLACTGDALVTRRLYTEFELEVRRFRRAVILTSVDLGALRPDLADRTAMVSLDPITTDLRATDGELAARWKRDRPGVFAGLLDLAVGVLNCLADPDRCQGGPKSRMADFVGALCAVDEILGTDGSGVYAEQAGNLAADAVASNPFLDAIRTMREPFTGTARELLDRITPTDPEWRKPRGWPANARAVTTLLHNHAGALRKVGWQVVEGKSGGHANAVQWHLAPPSLRPCRECGGTMDPDLWEAGERTHPAC